MTKRKIAAALVGLALVATPALAAMFPGLPIVGGAAFCASNVVAGVPGTSSICEVNVPAGPTIVTGLETIPADTNAAGGVQPQTVRLTLGSLNALPLTYATLTPATATNTLTAANTDGGVIIVGSAALSPTTINLPASPIDGQQFKISSTQTIASLTVAATGKTISNNPTALTVSTTAAYGYEFRYRASNTTWYRLQ